METLSETIEFLRESIMNVQSDLSSDWISEQESKKMQVQLQLLMRAIEALDTIALSGKNSQIFSSAIKF